MEILKIAAIGITASLLVLFVREHRPDVAVLIGLAAGILILFSVVNYLTEAISALQALMDKSGIDLEILQAVLKIIGIGYITEFAAHICEDSGSRGIADKILFGGKVLILIISLPLLSALIEIILSLLP